MQNAIHRVADRKKEALAKTKSSSSSSSSSTTDGSFVDLTSMKVSIIKKNDADDDGIDSIGLLARGLMRLERFYEDCS